MKVAIVKYNAGNIASVENALFRLGIEPILTDIAEELISADRVIFPGVGEASSAMKYLRERSLDIVLNELVQPVLGICLGMQLLCSHSEENDTQCIGIFDCSVKKFNNANQKVPHMGWNTIRDLSGSLFNNIKSDEYFYFVHSYYVEHTKDAISITDYGIEFSSAINKANFYGVQFHPERSGKAGAQIIENFLTI